MKEDAGNLLRGVAMGCADVVPGVSGGTVALVIGIYQRLVGALSRFDRTLIQLLRQRQWRKAAEHVDLRFLIGLAGGVLIGFVVMTLAMNRILKSENGRPLLMAAFFGMIFASSVLVARMIRPQEPRQATAAWLAALLGAAAMLSLLWLRDPAAEAATEPSPGFLFVCAATAICAMILPGISGAMVLLLWGVYAYLADIPHLLLHGEQVGKSLQTIAIFGAGCVVGLLSIAKILRWLLERHHAVTLACLCGVMVGALPQIWPFQRDLTPQVEEIKFKQFQPYWPDHWPSITVQIVLITVAAAAFVFAVDWCRRRLATSPEEIGKRL